MVKNVGSGMSIADMAFLPEVFDAVVLSDDGPVPEFELTAGPVPVDPVISGIFALDCEAPAPAAPAAAAAAAARTSEV